MQTKDAFQQKVALDMASEGLSAMESPSLAPHTSLTQKKEVDHTKHVYDHLLHQKVAICGILGHHLVMALARCGLLDDARNVFGGLAQPSVFAWTALISGYVDHGRAADALQLYDHGANHRRGSLEPNRYTFVSLLKACRSLGDVNKGRRLHGGIETMGLMSNAYIVNTLVSMYGKCGSVTDAENVFIVGMPGFDPVAWNAMLSVYAERGEEKKSMLLYRQMLEEGVGPDVRTLVILLQACVSNANRKAEGFDEGMAFDVGRALHSEARRRGFCSHGLLVTALVSMYGKCKQAVEAENVFSSTIRNRDAIMWNSMLTAYADSGDGTKALQAYVEMQRQGIPQDQHTFVISLQAACKLGGKQRCESALPDLGEALFLDAERRGFAGNSFIGNALIGLYGTCGDAMKAEEIFRGMHDRRDVSWNALMSAYMERGEEAKALRLYSRMRREGARPNRATYLVAIRACCARLLDVVTAAFSSEDRRSQAVFAVEIGRALHADAHAEGLVSDAAIASALVRMYGKLGLVSEAEVVFDGLARRNVVTWNAMLSAYVEQGRAENAMESFHGMMMPEDDGGVAALDDVTLICVLQASGLSCRIESCREAHFILTSLGFQLTLALATALVHAYGRCALANDARAVVHGLALALDAVLWSACIDAIAQASECAMSLVDAFESMHSAGLEPDRIAFFSILSACSHAGFTDTGLECCEAMAKLFGPKLDPKHYALMIDLHGRAGNFRKVANLLERMPTGDDDLPVDFSPVCSSLRGVCRIHENVEMGKVLLSIDSSSDARHLSTPVAGMKRWEIAHTNRCKGLEGMPAAFTAFLRQ